MYNLDHKEQIGITLPGGDYEELENKLIQDKYLKEPLDVPEDDCSYGYIKDSDDDYIIFCKVHGSVDLSSLRTPNDEYYPIPSYDKSKEKPFSYYYLSERAKKSGSRKSKKAIEDFQENIMYISMGLWVNLPAIILFLFIISLCIGIRKKKKT